MQKTWHGKEAESVSVVVAELGSVDGFACRCTVPYIHTAASAARESQSERERLTDVHMGIGGALPLATRYDEQPQCKIKLDRISNGFHGTHLI